MNFLLILMLAVMTPAKGLNAGAWTSPQNVGVTAIHAALLYTNQVLLWTSDTAFNNSGSQARLWNPTTNGVTTVNLPFSSDIFCAGMIELADGRILAIGGRDDLHPTEAGTAQSFAFDPSTSTWSQMANLNYARWYPTATELSDGTTLVTSGTDDNAKWVVPQEVYSYTANTWTVLPASANVSSTMDIYPRMALLSSGLVFEGGMNTPSRTFNPATNTWASAATLPVQRIYGAMVLLPSTSPTVALTAGGNPKSDQTGTATASAMTISLSQGTPAWSSVASMNYARQNENLVLLPDGTVLAVGGGAGGGRYSNPVFTPEDYNPITNIWTAWTPQAVQRTYHSTALLLPDGRVISAGSDSGKQSKTIEVFSPPYLSGVRPTIVTAPSSLSYGQQFTITTPDASSITRVALIKVASTTHATRFDERFVDLVFTVGSGQLTATMPANGNYAPPGYYMLDILNSSGVPAVMPFVQVTAPAGAQRNP